MDYPTSLACTKLDRKHAEWSVRFPYWEALRKLAEGGQAMYASAAQFLFARSMEPDDVYSDRLARFVYTNHFGNIKGWYTSALFKQPPAVVLRDGKTGAIRDDDLADELAAFQDDCDRAGHSLVQFWAEHVEPKLLTYRQAFILFDLPTTDGKLASKQAQKETGALRPHLVAYAPQDIINWQTDDRGNLIWANIKLRAVSQPDLTSDITVADRWYIFDREKVAVYEYVLTKDQQSQPVGPLSSALGLDGVIAPSQYGEDERGVLLDGYPRPHALADQSIVPIFTQTIHPDHWIGQRISAPLLRLLNLENALDWGLEQSNLATPVFYTNKELNKFERGEAYFLQLEKGDKAEYLEQSGNAFEIAQQRIAELREEIYRLAYLVAQGRSSSATASMQSGYSKEQDMMPARDVLAALGEQCRGAMQHLLQTAANRMELNVDVDVQGFDFLDRADVTELEVLQKGLSTVDITSPTLERESQKRVARIVLPDANRELYQTIDDEIDAAPTPNEVQQQQQEQAQEARLSRAAALSNPKLFADAANAE